MEILEDLQETLDNFSEEIQQIFFADPLLKKYTSFKIRTFCGYPSLYKKFGILKILSDWSVSDLKKKPKDIEVWVKQIIKSQIQNINVDAYSISCESHRRGYRNDKFVVITKDKVKRYFLDNEHCFIINYHNKGELEVQTDNLDLLELMNNLIEINFEGEITFKRAYTINSTMFSMIKRNKKLKDLLASTMELDNEIPYTKQPETDSGN